MSEGNGKGPVLPRNLLLPWRNLMTVMYILGVKKKAYSF
jgi:hypothetical protein